jgi:large subunit ribosomal protein L1
MDETILKVVTEARNNVKKRNFSQSFDLIINLKLIDLKKSGNRLNEVFILPKGRGKDANVVLFTESKKDVGCDTYGPSEIEKMPKNKRKLKTLAKTTDFFLSEPQLMPVIGKNLGTVLAPRGKMPNIAGGNLKAAVESKKKSIRIKLKDSPVIQCIVGVESMKDEDVAENIEAIIKFLEKKLPKGKNNIGKVMLKLTMGKPVKMSV